MKGYLYILKCSDGSYYTGSTTNVERRMSEHESGLGAKYTASRLPVELVYICEFERIDDAYFREKQVQGWSRKKKEALIKRHFEDLPGYAECKNVSHSSNKPSLSDSFDSAVLITSSGIAKPVFGKKVIVPPVEIK